MEPARKPEWWDEWTYFGKEARKIRLKEDALGKVRREWKELQKIMGYC